MSSQDTGEHEETPPSAAPEDTQKRRWKYSPRLRNAVRATGGLAAAAVVYCLWIWITLPGVGSLESERPETTSLMLQREREAKAEERQRRAQKSWIPFEHISKHLVRAVVAAEDANFYGHAGFDFHEMRQAVRHAWQGGRLRGASTISQQLAKNLFLSTERSMGRKIREALLTRRLERELSKKRILELYLNVIEWGDGIYGAEAAAQHYYGVSARQLTPIQAAQLAARIPMPRGHSRKFVQTRAKRILRWMRLAGNLSESEYQHALASNRG